jgi:hypothetical protein
MAAALHRRLPVLGSNDSALGTARWQPAPEVRDLAHRLETAFAASPIIDLILFGSQARGSTTGFSDVDAILVIDDATAENPAALHALRPRVLAAQRAVLAHQPMQHHGFEVVTPKLLLAANHALAMPSVALSESRSLTGKTVEASFVPDDDDEFRAALSGLALQTGTSSAWPSHSWHLHRLLSMFELMPTLYLQARGEIVPKSRSFAIARRDFGDAWWPYDVLERVRREWRRRPARALSAAAVATRNPWVAHAVWRRLPALRANEARALLTIECLSALQALGRKMVERSG